MVLSNRKMTRVIGLLKKSVLPLPDPSVTMVGKKWKNPFLVLISCILSLRTKDEVTLPASQRLFKLGRTPRQILKLHAEKIAEIIYPVAFYRVKAKNIQAICRILMERFDSRVPEKMDVLLTLPGVGRKTANLVLTEGFGRLGLCVDTHVHRISNRLGYVRTRTPEETEWALRKKLPKPFWIEYNNLLVTWGQNICRPISPFCSRCDIRHLCQKVNVSSYR